MLELSIAVNDKVSNDQSLNHSELLQLQHDLSTLREMSTQDYKMIAEWAVAQLLSNEITSLTAIEQSMTGGEDELRL